MDAARPCARARPTTRRATWNTEYGIRVFFLFARCPSRAPGSTLVLGTKRAECQSANFFSMCMCYCPPCYPTDMAQCQMSNVQCPIRFASLGMWPLLPCLEVSVDSDRLAARRLAGFARYLPSALPGGSPQAASVSLSI